jgi:hypothetical protein
MKILPLGVEKNWRGPSFKKFYPGIRWMSKDDIVREWTALKENEIEMRFIVFVQTSKITDLYGLFSTVSDRNGQRNSP